MEPLIRNGETGVLCRVILHDFAILRDLAVLGAALDTASCSGDLTDDSSSFADILDSFTDASSQHRSANRKVITPNVPSLASHPAFATA